MQSNAWGKWGAVHRASEGTVSSAECPDPSPGGHVSVSVLLQGSVLGAVRAPQVDGARS